MRQLFLLLLLLNGITGFAQDKVVWNTSYNTVNQELVLKASVAEGWHLYSQFIKNDIGPVPTAFEFTKVEGVELVGNVEEQKAIQEYDPNFEAELSYFKGETVFKQKIKRKTTGSVAGNVTYMVCNDVMCLPPVDHQFVIAIQ